MTLEEQLEEQAKRGLLGLGVEQETAEEYAPWASLLAQFIPGVGEGVGIDNTRDAINDERYGDAAIEGGLTLLGVIPGIGDVAAAAIKGIRKAPIAPKRSRKKVADMTPEEHEAHKAWMRERYRKNPEQFKNYSRQNYKNNPEKWKQSTADYYQRNKEARLEYAKRYREENKEAVAKKIAEWRDKNPGRVNALRAKYEAAKIERTPAWADPDRIEEIYRTAAEASAETGIPYHVDHVIPLQGRNVSGLHHQDNLLVIPATENHSKYNKFEPGDLPPRAGVRKARKLLKEIRDGKKK